MVIVLMGLAGAAKSTVAAGLAERLGWRFVDADVRQACHALHGLVARAIDRRESLVLACPLLTAHERGQLIGDLRPVRVVWVRSSLETFRGEPEDAALTVDAAADIDTVVGHIRREFGV